jgi:hypothetical protein
MRDRQRAGARQPTSGQAGEEGLLRHIVAAARWVLHEHLAAGGRRERNARIAVHEGARIVIPACTVNAWHACCGHDSRGWPGKNVQRPIR